MMKIQSSMDNGAPSHEPDEKSIVCQRELVDEILASSKGSQSLFASEDKSQLIDNLSDALPKLITSGRQEMDRVCKVLSLFRTLSVTLTFQEPYLVLFDWLLQDFADRDWTSEESDALFVLFSSKDFISEYFEQSMITKTIFITSSLDARKIEKFWSICGTPEFCERISDNNVFTNVILHVLGENSQENSGVKAVISLFSFCQARKFSFDFNEAVLSRMGAYSLTCEKCNVKILYRLLFSIAKNSNDVLNGLISLFHEREEVQDELLALVSEKHLLVRDNLAGFCSPIVCCNSNSLSILFQSILVLNDQKSVNALLEIVKSEFGYPILADDIAQFLIDNMGLWSVTRLFSSWKNKELLVERCRKFHVVEKLFEESCKRTNYSSESLTAAMSITDQKSDMRKRLTQVLLDRIHETSIIGFCLASLLDDEIFYIASKQGTAIPDYQEKLRFLNFADIVQPRHDYMERLVDVLPAEFDGFNDFLVDLPANSEVLESIRNLKSSKFAALHQITAYEGNSSFYQTYRIGKYAVPVHLKLNKEIPQVESIISRFVREEDLRVLVCRDPAAVARSFGVDYLDCSFFELCGDSGCWLEPAYPASSIEFSFHLEKCDGENFVTLVTFNGLSLFVCNHKLYDNDKRQVATLLEEWHKLEVRLVSGFRSRVEVRLDSSVVFSKSDSKLMIEFLGDKESLHGAHILIRNDPLFIPCGNSRLVPFCSAAMLLREKTTVKWLFKEIANGNYGVIQILAKLPRHLPIGAVNSFCHGFLYKLEDSKIPSRMKYIGMFMDSIMHIQDYTIRTDVYTHFLFDFVLVDSFETKEVLEWVDILSRVDQIDFDQLLLFGVGAYFLSISQKFKNIALSSKLVGLLMYILTKSSDPNGKYRHDFVELALYANQLGLADMGDDAMLFRIVNPDFFQDSLSVALLKRGFLDLDSMLLLALKVQNVDVVAEMFDRIVAKPTNLCVIGKVAQKLVDVPRIRNYVCDRVRNDAKFLPIALELAIASGTLESGDQLRPIFEALQVHGVKVFDSGALPYFIDLLRMGKADIRESSIFSLILPRFFVEITPSMRFLRVYSEYLCNLAMSLIGHSSLDDLLCLIAFHSPEIILIHIVNAIFVRLTTMHVSVSTMKILRSFLHRVFCTKCGVAQCCTSFGAITTFCRGHEERWSALIDLLIAYGNAETLNDLLSMCEPEMFLDDMIVASLLKHQLTRYAIQHLANLEGIPIMDLQSYERVLTCEPWDCITPSETCSEMMCNFLRQMLPSVHEACKAGASRIAAHLDSCLRIHERTFGMLFEKGDTVASRYLSPFRSTHSFGSLSLTSPIPQTIVGEEVLQKLTVFTYSFPALKLLYLKELAPEARKFGAEFSPGMRLGMFEKIYGTFTSYFNCVFLRLDITLNSVVFVMENGKFVILISASMKENKLWLGPSLDRSLEYAIFSGILGPFSVFMGHYLLEIEKDDILGQRIIIDRPAACLPIELVTIRNGTFVIEFEDPELKHPFECIPVTEHEVMTEDWMTRCTSTFEYLTEINLRSGRSVASMSNYPVFPFVISETFGESRFLSNIRSFEKYDVIELNSALIPSNTRPSTQNKLEYISFKSQLTPEWFTCPEVFGNIELPNWAKSPYHFLEMNRYALEKSTTIEKWIDGRFAGSNVTPRPHPSRFLESRISLNLTFRGESNERPLNCFLDWESKWPRIVAAIVTDNECLECSEELKQCVKIWPGFAPGNLLKFLRHFDVHNNFASLTIDISLVVIVQLAGNKTRPVTRKFAESPKFTLVNGYDMICCTVCSHYVEVWCISNGATVVRIDEHCTAAVFDTEGRSLFLAMGSVLKQFTNTGSLVRQIDLGEEITALSLFRSGFTFVDMVICAGDRRGDVHLCMISLEGDLYVKKEQNVQKGEIYGFSKEIGGQVVAYSLK